MVLLPNEFIERMKKMLGEEADLFFKSYEEERALGLRINPCKVTKEFFEQYAPFSLTKISWAKYGYFYESENRPGRYPWHEAGVYYIQEPSAMIPAECLDARPGERILDLCAAPGGKSTQIAGNMRGEGILFCNEIHPERAKILSQNIERLGFSHVFVLNESPASLAEHFTEYFDKIMVDAPCSGEGMFRKDEEARNQWSEEHVQLCAKRQDEILRCAFQMLKPGGRLVYSTCTFAPEEDEGSVARFLEAYPNMMVLDLEEVRRLHGFSRGRVEELQEMPLWIQDQITKTIRVWPHKIQGEGHFIAVLEKKAEPALSSAIEKETGKRKKQKQTQASFKRLDSVQFACYQEFIKETMAEPTKWLDMERLVVFGEQVYYLPNGSTALLDGIRVLRPGLHLGTLKKNRFEPAHALALHVKAEDVLQVQSVKAEEEEIGKYLRGETLLAEDGIKKGWVLLLVDGFSIGWMKAVGGILKNHYPKGLRYMGR